MTDASPNSTSSVASRFSEVLPETPSERAALGIAATAALATATLEIILQRRGLSLDLAVPAIKTAVIVGFPAWIMGRAASIFGGAGREIYYGIKYKPIRGTPEDTALKSARSIESQTKDLLHGVEQMGSNLTELPAYQHVKATCQGLNTHATAELATARAAYAAKAVELGLPERRPMRWERLCEPVGAGATAATIMALRLIAG